MNTSLLYNVLGNEPLRHRTTARVRIELRAPLQEATVLVTADRLLIGTEFPLGLTVSEVPRGWIEDLTVGETKDGPYVQVLGRAARILFVFYASRRRDELLLALDGGLP